MDTTTSGPSLEKQIKGHRSTITGLSYSPNEPQIASSSLDNSIILSDVDGPLRSYRFSGHKEAVMDVTFSPTGKYMASASQDKTVRMWVPNLRGSSGVFRAHSQTVRSVQFSPDESKLITASDDKIVKLWTSDKFKLITTFVGHTNWVRSARICNDGNVIASSSDDKTSRLWNTDTGELINTYKDEKGHGLCLAWHPSGCYIAVGTTQGKVKMYDIRTNNLVQYYSIHNDDVTQIAFHPSGTYILTASKDGTMKILDLLEGHPIFTLIGHRGAVNSVTFSPSGKNFASAGDDKMVNIWKTNFTDLADDVKENKTQNQTEPMGTRIWYLCYHSMKYPVTSFVHINDKLLSNCGSESCREASMQEPPNANSTLAESRGNSPAVNTRGETILSSSFLQRNPSDSGLRNVSCQSPECASFAVGHMSQIPRSSPPKPGTYTIPSILNTLATEIKVVEEDDLFGMIKLKHDDICYTNGTIEWIGRKRTYPLNSGFKVLSDNHGHGPESLLKKSRLDRSSLSGRDKLRECDCADVLPTVNALVDHLNALHEAVDIVDLRLNTLENVLSKNE